VDVAITGWRDEAEQVAGYLVATLGSPAGHEGGIAELNEEHWMVQVPR